MNTPYVGVTGAHGWVGRSVCAWLQNRGCAVLKLSRLGGEGSRRLDLADNATVESWASLLGGVTAIVHCAARVHRPDETPAEKSQFERVNIHGTRRLIDAARIAGVDRLVLVSSLSVYDWTQIKGPATERSPLGPATSYGASKLEAERLLQTSGLDWRIARLATVYGIGDQANFRKLATALRRRRFVMPGDSTARKSVLPVSLAGQLLGTLALTEQDAGRVFNLAAPEAPTLREICDVFVEACGFRRPPSAPISLLRLAGWMGDFLYNRGVPAPITSSILQKLTTSTVVDVSAMRARWPDVFWPSFRQTIAESAAYYAQ